jgi:hypothetical protein
LVDALSQKQLIFSVITLKVDLRDHILREQDEDDWCKEVRVVMYGKNICKRNMEGHSCDDDVLVIFMKKIVVPDRDGVCEIIMK